ncbi:helix-turn-helix transcriptional regulator [Salicibibacter cibarius]|uniref:Helix-turn-helix transcriptional regulator n=1 Tax=Salicibibacter cibarius TaxID=2743000 RepID=A0A7T7C9W0_9BACI|nr:helix-turn-helix transcriptional regulator [Salicibibacter cibarius]QQK74210.1 helix-turn-helix transcriptional regulator [Salicibibacter cibarius]
MKLSRRGFRYLRFRESLNQYEYAAIIGISQRLVSAIELGNRKVSPRTAALVWAAFKLDDNEVLTLEERG